MFNFEKKILKLFKGAKTKKERSIFIILGAEGIQKVPYLYKLVTHEKLLPIAWFSNEITDIRKSIWTASGNKDEENSIPEITHILFRDIENTLHQQSYFAVVQDMENIKPSDLVRVVESVLGKGALIFIFSKVKELNMFTSPKVCDLAKSKFMKRLFASFTSCPSCLVLDENLNILFSPKNGSENKIMVEEANIEEQPNLPLNDDDDNSEIFKKLIEICGTEDQSNFLRHCLATLKRRTIHCTLSVSSPQGRGKSVVMGLAIAGAIALKYSNIFISSLTYENVKIIFKYLLIGLDVMQFKEDEDYDLIQSLNPKFNNALLGLNIFRDHPQAVRFIFPGDVENKLEQAELVVIDEAAAMPLPLLKKLLGPYIVLMSSTIEGCGGSGKYLYENMISEINHASSHKDKVSLESLFPTSETSSWKQFKLSEPINYSSKDEVESWINHALCLKANVVPPHGCPDPESCRLFYVCRETLFSYEKHAENFLQELMALFFCTKRTLSPNILQEIADDENYHIFCLISPHDSSKKGSADILCAILVHTEKRIPWNIIYSGINQHGDLQECFNKWTSPSEKSEDFLSVQGLHIVDVVTYPSYRKMGYGSRTLQLLQDFYEGKCVSLDDTPHIYSCKSKKFSTDNALSWPPLLLQLTEVEPEKVDYILVSYYLTADLLRFWKKVEFVPVYISGEKNSAQEHICFMMKAVGNEILSYMKENWKSFCDYYFMHLSSYLKCFPSELALNLLNCKFSKQIPKEALTKEDIDIYLKPQRMKALEKYCQNLSDLHCIMPCIPVLAKLFFSRRFVGIDMSVAQQVILLAFGVQHKTIEDISADLSLHTTQVHGLLNRTVRKLTTYLTNIIEKAVENTIAVRDVNMEPVSQSLDDELEEAAQKIKEKQMEDLKKLKEMDFSEFAIKGSEDDWEKALHSGRKTLVSIKSLKKAPEHAELPSQEKNKSFKQKKKEMKRRR